MTKHRWLLALPLAACTSQTQGKDDATVSMTGIGSLTGGGSSGGGTEGDSMTSMGSNASADETAADENNGPKFDTEDPGFCAQREAGVYCTNDNVAITCNADGDSTGSENCDPNYCLEGTGCVECLAGQFTCMGDSVMSCNDAAVPPAWQLVEVCDPNAGEGCDLGLGACAVLGVIGTEVPTGNYYQFAEFATGSTDFRGGYDVDSFDNRLYVLNGSVIDVYTVALLDSDADGQFEPNQHPDNPDMPGAIETRTITYVETLPSFGTPSSSVSEILALEDRIYIGGSRLTEMVFGVAGETMISTPPGFVGNFSQIGYDDVNGVWYASQESQRRVIQRNEQTGAWGIAFLFPNLAGDHMDGLEVVTDPETGIPYVYVSDMTSDFIGQYRMDPNLGWVQENLFSYVGTAGSLVEGMGFGALNHFWATGGGTVYELGGGDLSEYTEPPG